MGSIHRPHWIPIAKDSKDQSSLNTHEHAVPGPQAPNEGMGYQTAGTDYSRAPDIWNYLAFGLNIAVIALLATVVFVPLHLTSSGPLNGEIRTLYVTCVTVLATIYTTYSIKCIRALWLSQVDVQLWLGSELSTVDSLWRNLMGVSSMVERFHEWQTTCVLLVCSLGTAAVVGALVPTLATRSEDYQYALFDDNGYLCSGTEQTTQASDLNWIIPNGSTYNVLPNMNFCPTAEALSLMGGINTLNPETFGYSDNGVAIRRGALGCPASIYSSQTNYNLNKGSRLFLNNTLEKYRSSLVSTTQCVPVMTSNPFHCTVVGTSYKNQVLTVSAPSTCPLKFDTTQLSNANILCTHDQLGIATIVFGSITGYTFFLSEAMADYSWLSMADELYESEQRTPNVSESAYGVVCTVDTRTAFEYRKVRLTLQRQQDSDTGRYSRSLDAVDDQPCSIPGMASTIDPLTTKIPATAAAAAWQPLFAGFIDTTRQFITQPGWANDHADFVRKPPYAFANSENALEDVLAINAALVVSHISLTGGSGSYIAQGQAIIEYSRIGTGRTWALVYVLPPLAILAALVYSYIESRKPPHRHEISSRLQTLSNHFAGR